MYVKRISAGFQQLMVIIWKIDYPESCWFQQDIGSGKYGLIDGLKKISWRKYIPQINVDISHVLDLLVFVALSNARTFATNNHDYEIAKEDLEIF